MPPSQGLTIEEYTALLADFGVEASTCQVVDPAQFAEARGGIGHGKGSVLLGPIGTGLDMSAASNIYRRHADPLLATDGAVLLAFKPPRREEELARWRTQLWPWLHVGAVYRTERGATVRETLQGRASVASNAPSDGIVLAARRREHVLSPASTVAKFDQNAPGWNGEPGSRGYAHFRWMRRFVARFARVQGGARVLDFGCGAGWVGIEAALSAKDVELCAFDPSPEMVRLAGENARTAGLTRFTGRTGFGEAPPFPAAGEKPFDVVYSSGVASFSPDLARWTDGLVATLAPGATLVIGDIHRESRGMQKRRASRVLLPAREMNALVRDEMRKLLEQRGLAHEASAGYQLTDPVPQLVHRSGLLAGSMLALNRMLSGATSRGAQKHFDSWVMRLRMPA